MPHGAFAPLGHGEFLPLDPGTPGTRNPATQGAEAATVDTVETTTSVAYTDLATVGPTVDLWIPNGLALVSIYCRLVSDTAGESTRMAFAVSGVNTQVAADEWSITDVGTAARRLGATFLLTGLSRGVTTFTAKYNVTAGTGTFSSRRIAVVPL